MSINKVILIGNVGKKPEFKQTQSGQEVASFSLATTESWKDKTTGEKKDKTEWHNIAVFSQGLINIIRQYVDKGSKLYIEGSIETAKYSKDGSGKYITRIVLKNFNHSIEILNSQSQYSQSQSQDDEDEIDF